MPVASHRRAHTSILRPENPTAVSRLTGIRQVRPAGCNRLIGSKKHLIGRIFPDGYIPEKFIR